MEDIQAASEGRQPQGDPNESEINVEPLPAEEGSSAKPEATPDPPKEEAKEPEAPKEPTPVERVIKHRGQEVKLALKPEEEIDYIQKGYDYTAKTMELANFRKQAEAIIEQTRQEQKAQAEAVMALLSDADKLEMIAAGIRQKQGLPAASQHSAQPNEDDDLPVSKSELKAYLTDLEKKVEARVRAESQTAKQTVKEDIEYERMEGNYRLDFNAHVDALVKEKFPVLSEFDDQIEVADRIRKDANAFVQAFMTLNPGVAINPQQVKSVMTESAKRRAEVIEGKLRKREKQVALSKAELRDKGPEPRGGNAAPTPPAGKPPKLNDPSLEAAVLREIQSIMGKG
jgi:hypothetical protein